MGYDENEMLIEYSEMTAFNFKSKEYQEAIKDFTECKEAVHNFEWFVKSFVSKFRRKEENV